MPERVPENLDLVAATLAAGLLQANGALAAALGKADAVGRSTAEKKLNPAGAVQLYREILAEMHRVTPE